MKMHLLLAAALAGVQAIVPATGARAATDYRVTGNRAIKEGAILGILQSTAGGEPERIRALQEAYFRAGHLQARVTVARSWVDSTTVLTIDEGSIATVDSVVVQGAQAIPASELVAAIGLRPGDPFRPTRIERRIGDVLRRYDRDGFPFAQIWIESVRYQPEPNKVTLRLSIVEGTRRAITGVLVEGLEKTRPQLAVRVAGLRTGTPYSARVVEDARLRLVSSGLFESVDSPVVRVSSDGQGLDAVLRVRENARSNSFAAAVGWASAEVGEDKRTLNGLAHLKLVNIGGSLKDFEVLWSNDGRERTETRIAYRDRFFLGQLLTLGLRLEQTGQDTLYTWQSLGVEAEKPVGRAGQSLLVVGAGLFADRNVFSSGPLLRSWRYRGALSVSFLRGGSGVNLYRLRTRVAMAHKRNTLRPDSTATLRQLIVEAEGDATWSFGRLLHGRLVPVYRSIESNEAIVPLSEQFYIGGARTLRGYRESRFHGRRVATLASELLVGPSRRENGYLFVDAGYVLQENLRPDGTVAAGDLWPVGFGFGFRTASPLGNIDLSFGMGDEISLRQTKVHVLLEQRF